MHPPTQNTHPSARTARHRRPWYLSSGLALIVFCLCGVFCIGMLIAVLGGEANKATLLILKNDGCTHLQYHHLATLPYPAAGTCTAAVTFRKNDFDQGGTVVLEDRELHIPADQIVTTESLLNAPESPLQRTVGVGLWVSFLLALGCVVWFVVALDRREKT